MHATEFFGGGPMEPKEIEAGDHGEVPDEVSVDVQAEVLADAPADAPVKGMRDTHEQRTTADLVVSLGSPYFTKSNLLGSRLAPQSLGIRCPAGGIHIREGGSSGGSGIQPQFSLDAWSKALTVEGEGSEAHLADYISSLREALGGGVPPSGPGGSSTHVSLSAFST